MALFGFGKKKETPAPAPVAPKPAPAPKAEPPKPAPDPDSPEALYRKGMDLRGLGRYSAAFPTLLLAAGKGHGEAMLECARMYQRGEGIGKNLKLALGLAEKAAAQNVPGASGAKAEIAAQFLLEDGGSGKPAAKAPENSKSAPEPPKPGEEDFQKGEELRKAKDWDGAAAAWTKAAEQEHPEALKKLTGFYAGDRKLWGLGSKESRAKYVDYDKVIQWGTTAMERGVDVADRIMDAYEKKGQIEKAIDFGEKAVSRGFDAEWKLMYLCIEAGRYEDAIVWGQKYDEKKGMDEAKKRIAQIGDEAFNKGVAANKDKDYPQALAFFEKSAGLGEPSAMFNCGLLYDDGIGTAKDKVRAFMWYEKAANQGYEKAYYFCAESCFYNDGSMDYLQKSLTWYKKAGKLGDQNSTKAIEKAEKLSKIISAIQQVITGTSKTDKQIAAFLSLTDDERKKLIDSNIDLSRNQRIAVAHFQSLQLIAGIDHLKTKEDKLFAQKVAATSRKNILGMLKNE